MGATTQAEEIVDYYRSATTTLSLARLAIEAGADQDHQREDRMTFYHFPDGSTIGTMGRGHSYQFWTTRPIAAQPLGRAVIARPGC